MECVLRREPEVPAEPFGACMTWSEQKIIEPHAQKTAQQERVVTAQVEDWLSSLEQRIKAQGKMAKDAGDAAGKASEPPRPPRLPCREPASPLLPPYSTLWGTSFVCTEDLPVNFNAVETQRVSAQRRCPVTLHAENLEKVRRDFQDSEALNLTAF